MAEKIPINTNYLNFITNLVTTVRQISIYPPKHPIIVNSMKSVSSSLNSILADKNILSVTLSPDSKIFINGEYTGDKSSVVVMDFMPYFKKLDIEEISFTPGTTDKEIDEFIRIIIADANEIKKSGDINKLFSERGIEHIKAKQFSYLKVEKGKEGIVIEGSAQELEKLKAKINDFCLDKIEKKEEISSIEKEIFDLIKSEFKEKNKLSLATKNMLKKFLSHSKEKEDTLTKLKNALQEYGCPANEVDSLLSKINQELTAPLPTKKRTASAKEIEVLVKENEELKSMLGRLQGEINDKASLVKDLEKQNRRVHDEKQRISNIVHNLAEGMVVVDAEGKILLVNSTAETMLGITKEDIGKPIKEVVKDEHLLTLTKKIAAEQEGEVEKEIELVSADESTKRVLRTSQAVVEDHNGNTVGMVTMLNDITKQKEIEKVKSEFLSNVSHELRTPLVAIEKSVSLILSKQTGEISEAQNQFLSIAERNLKRLTLLINDLLDLSKLEARKMEIKPESVVLEKIITDSCETLNNWAKTKSIKLEKVIQQNLPAVNIDPNRMIQVLNNLIGNAIKFTPKEGTITVEASKPQDQNLVRVEVRDTGVGISPEDLVKVFDKFYQAKERAATDISGTGIGLAIVREIVELHGGKVWAESQKGQGARFIFTIPL